MVNLEGENRNKKNNRNIRKKNKTKKIASNIQEKFHNKGYAFLDYRNHWVLP